MLRYALLRSVERRLGTHLFLRRTIGTDHKWWSNKYVKIGIVTLSSAAIVGACTVAWQMQGLKQSLSSKRFHLVDKAKPDPDVTEVSSTAQNTNHQDDNKKFLFQWLQLHSHKPEVLLRLAQSEDHSIRLLAVKALAAEHGWSDEEYASLAAALDHRTIAGLARTPGADPRFFVAPPKRHKTKTPLDEQMRRLIARLPVNHLDKCTKFFTHKAMQECPESKKLERFFWSIVGHDLNIEPSRSELDRLITYGLTTITKLSSLPSHCHKIVQEGGLEVLQRVYEARDTSVKFMRCIALILANLALHPQLHGDIIDAGWVSILHTWANGRDMELSLKAAKALANLDEDFGGAKKYPEGVYLYYPKARFSDPVYADIVFVHGLRGGPFKTWRQKDSVYVARAKALKLQQEKAQKQQREQQEKLQRDQQPPNPESQKSPENSGKSSSNNNETDKQNTTSNKENYAQTQSANSTDRQTNTKTGDSEQAMSNTCSNNNAQQTQQIESNDTCDSCDTVSNQSRDSKQTLESQKSLKQKLKLDKLKDLDAKKLFGLKKFKEKPSEDKSKSNWYTFCWPKDWLASDIPNARIMSVGYETFLNEWEAECPYESEKRALSVRSLDILEKLRQAGIGDRPVIWVGHSMGGLLIKQMLLHASADVRYKRMTQQSRGVIFYSVPHRGSELARYAKKIQRLYAPSTEVKELVTDCPRLLDLHSKFGDLVSANAMPVLSFAEGQETPLPFNLKLVIVPEESCNPGFGEFHKMEELTHLDICKPENPASRVYRLTLEFIHKCVSFDAVTNVLRASMHDSADDSV